MRSSPPDVKVKYLNGLLRVGFDTIDIGSFVSARAIPQLVDSAEVLARIDMDGVRSKLLVIVANERGAEDAAKQERVTYLGYPFSISETFQQRNTNTEHRRLAERTQRIAEIAANADKQLVVYISMAFGNPYGDPWNTDVALRWTERLVNELGVRIISLADTVGVARTRRTCRTCSRRRYRRCRKWSSVRTCTPGRTTGSRRWTRPGRQAAAASMVR